VIGLFEYLNVLFHFNLFTVWMDEFNINKISIEKFKMMTGGESFAAQVKFQNEPVFVKIQVPQMYLSNRPLRRRDVDEAVWSRLNVVNTAHSLEYRTGFVDTDFDDKTCPSEYSSLWSWNEEKVKILNLIFCYTNFK
jgi:hypothetical protein